MTKLEAIEASMEHWQRDVIGRMLADNWKDGFENMFCRGDSCALCKWKWAVAGKGNAACSVCPVCKYFNTCSLGADSPWADFMNAPTLETAITMWSCLCLLREIEIQGE